MEGGADTLGESSHLCLGRDRNPPVPGWGGERREDSLEVADTSKVTCDEVATHALGVTDALRRGEDTPWWGRRYPPSLMTDTPTHG